MKVKRKRRVKTEREGAILFDYDFYTIYNKLKKKVKKALRINNRSEYLAFCRLFFRIIGEEIREREAGVSIKGLGYFYIYLIPRKMPVKYWGKDNRRTERIMHNTGGRIYTYCFIPAKKFEYWSMDNTFSKPLKEDLFNRLNGGQRYNGYPYTIKKLI